LTEPRTWTLTINRLPVSQNDPVWREKWKQYRYKRDWMDDVYWSCREQQIPALKCISLSIVVYFKTRAHRDLDNYHPTTCKAIQDGLSHAGVIPTDDERYIPQLPTLRFFIDCKNPRTEVTVTEIA